MRLRVGLLTLVALLSLISALNYYAGSVAQEAATCDPAGLIGQLASLKSTSDQQQDMQTLLDLSASISRQNIACNGFSFSGTGAFVSDPFDLPQGAYRMNLTVADGKSILATVENVGEDYCSGLVNSSKLTSRLDARKGCRATLNITANVDDGEWSVTLESLQ